MHLGSPKINFISTFILSRYIVHYHKFSKVNSWHIIIGHDEFSLYGIKYVHSKVVNSCCTFGVCVHVL